MLKLKLQYFGHLMQRADSLEKTLVLGKIEGGRRSGQQRMRRFITVSMDVSLSKLQEMVKDREVWHTAVYGVSKSRTQLSNWMTTEGQDKWLHDTERKYMGFLPWRLLPMQSSILGSLACASPWGHKESGRTEWLNNNNIAALSVNSQDICQFRLFNFAELMRLYARASLTSPSLPAAHPPWES